MNQPLFEKKCFKCNIIKTLDEFYAHPEMPDGHVNKCKECNKKDVQLNYRRNIKHYALYDKLRENTKKRKEARLEMQRKRRSMNPLKYKANVKSYNAIRDGKLIRKPCEVCGELKVEGHHKDYSKPLDVQWLCFKHHREIHGQRVRI